MTHRIIFLGPPGAGKGTQAEKLCNHLNLKHTSTGVVLREAVQSGSELGKQVSGYMNSGALVPDQTITAVVKEKLTSYSAETGYLLDGYPRTLEQAKSLAEITKQLNAPLTNVVEIIVPEEIVLGRIRERAKAEARTDDSVEVAKKRMQVYREQTAPLSEYYRSLGMLKEIDGVGTVEEVFSKIIAAL